MSEENKQESDVAEKQPSLTDTIYLALGIPEINAEMAALFALHSKTLAILRDSDIISSEQVNEILIHASERVADMCRKISEGATSDKELIAEAVERIEKAGDKRLSKMREQLNLTT